MTGLCLRIAAPAREVFDYLVDPRHRPEWQSSLRAVDLLDPAPIGVGTRWVDRTVLGARPRLWIVEMRPPGPDTTGVWREVGRWRGLRAELGLCFAVDGPRATRVTGAVELTSSPRWAPVRVVLGLLAPPAVAADLGRAARLLESRASSA